MEIDTETILLAIPVVLVALSHLAALVGNPAWINNVTVIRKIFNLLAANYGKAVNKDDPG